MHGEQSHELVERAIQAREQAYAPYSRFKVGAAILTSSGRIFCGCNVENASYGAGICAERNAALQAVYNGERRFVAVAVAGWADGAEGEARVYAYPCGICRQFMNEFAAPDMQVQVARSADDVRSTRLSALLPESFGPESLSVTAE